jgi:phosphohistidine phosphatase SixA
MELDDYERPLSTRGRAAASAMAKHMRGTKIAPDIVLCSTAVKTGLFLRACKGARSRSGRQVLQQTGVDADCIGLTGQRHTAAIENDGLAGDL